MSDINKKIEGVFEGVFDKMSAVCKYRSNKSDLVPECFYYGSQNKTCAREICPILKEERDV